MRDFLLLGVRHRPDVEPLLQGPFATRGLGEDRGPALAAAAEAALADVGWQGVGRGRNSFVLRVFDGREVRRLIEGVGQVRDTGPVPALFRMVWHVPDPSLPAASALAELCDLVAADPGITGRTFLERLGEQAAGISPGWSGWADLLTGGRNPLPGDGFRPEFADGTTRQVRHFAGTAAAAARLGGPAARVAAVLRGDLARSPDGRLSREAIAFAGALVSGSLAPSGAGAWVRERLCAPAPGG